MCVFYTADGSPFVRLTHKLTKARTKLALRGSEAILMCGGSYMSENSVCVFKVKIGSVYISKNNE